MPYSKRYTRQILIICLVFCAQLLSAQIFVNASANSGGDGSSWDKAFNNLQEAIDAAKEGDQIWVAKGTYLPGNLDAPEETSFLLEKGIELYGGFNGAETSLSERKFSENLTILSGDLKQDDLTKEFDKNRDDNVWTVLMIRTQTISIPLIDGFVIEGGHSDGDLNLGFEPRGGGIFSYGPFVMKNCQLRQNYARLDGGGLFLWDSLSINDPIIKKDFLAQEHQISIDSCTFYNNYTVNSGAGMSQVLIRGNTKNSQVRHCQFIDNETGRDGGGVENFVSVSEANTLFEDCLFEGNMAEDGGGITNIIWRSNVQLTLRNCDFIENTSHDKLHEAAISGGGGARIFFMKKASESVATVTNCTFTANNSILPGGGLAIKTYPNATRNLAKVDRSSFEQNKASAGGGLSFISQGIQDSLILQNNIFSNNKAVGKHKNLLSTGGALVLQHWADGEDIITLIDSVLFSNNISEGDGGGAIGILPFNDSNFTTISNSDFTSNQTNGNGGAILFNGFTKNFEIVRSTFEKNKAKGAGNEVHEKIAVDNSLFFLFFQGALWIQILYSFIFYLMTRDRLTLYFILIILGISVFFFFMYDFSRFPFFVDNSLGFSTHFVIVKLGIFCNLLGFLKFSESYLDINKLLPWTSKILSYFLTIYLVFELANAALIKELIPTSDNKINEVINGATMIFIVIGFLTPLLWSIFSYFKGLRIALFFVPAILCSTIAGMSLVVLYNSNLLITPQNILLIQIFILLTLILIAIANGYRTNQLKKEKDKADRLSELDQAKTRLYNNITHEFRTPLTVIMGTNEMIKGNEKEKDLIQRNSQQLLKLINQMLDLSKLEGGSLKLKLIQGDIIPFIEYLVESFQSLAASKEIQLTLYSELESLIMDYDAEKLQAILSNLVSNAVKFTPKFGKIIVHVKEVAEEGKNYLNLLVKDSGQGIPTEDLPHIFDRFFQSDASDLRRSEGSGIGLALVKELVQLMEGEIEVESKIGKGSVFTIKIPVTKNASTLSKEIVKSIDSISETSTIPQETSPAFMPPNIQDAPVALIVEDNKDVVQFLKACLQNNYQLEIAYNGKEGIEKALSIVPDIIISDVMMPEVDGYTLCDTLKRDERTSHIPIIILTAKVSQQDKLKGLEMGADAYLNKPFQQKELLLRLQKLIELRQQLQKKYQSILDQPNSSPKGEDPFVQKLRSILEEHLEEEEFGISELCAEAQLSRMQVHRKLKALTGMPTSQFIHTIRLQKAYTLLKEEDLNVSEVAYRVGFSDHSYFTKLFVKKFNQRPSEVGKKAL